MFVAIMIASSVIFFIATYCPAKIKWNTQLYSWFGQPGLISGMQRLYLLNLCILGFQCWPKRWQSLRVALHNSWSPRICVRRRGIFPWHPVLSRLPFQTTKGMLNQTQPLNETNSFKGVLNFPFQTNQKYSFQQNSLLH